MSTVEICKSKWKTNGDFIIKEHRIIYVIVVYSDAPQR